MTLLFIPCIIIIIFHDRPNRRNLMYFHDKHVREPEFCATFVVVGANNIETWVLYMHAYTYMHVLFSSRFQTGTKTVEEWCAFIKKNPFDRRP